MSTRILVVDDNEVNVELLVAVFASEHYVVSTATDGFEALAKIAAENPDIVLLDVMMPGLDGLDTMRIIRQLDGYRSLPIIAVTAKAMMGDRDKCLEAGATDYVAKPVNIDVLLATLWRTLPHDEQSRQLQ